MTLKQEQDRLADAWDEFLESLLLAVSVKQLQIAAMILGSISIGCWIYVLVSLL